MIEPQPKQTETERGKKYDDDERSVGKQRTGKRV